MLADYQLTRPGFCAFQPASEGEHGFHLDAAEGRLQNMCSTAERQAT